MGGLFFTLFYGILDLETRALTYVSAGHPAAVRVAADGTPSNLAATGPPIGAVRDSAWREGEVTLEPGDRLYVYSDGLTEGQSPQGSFFGSERLVDLLCRSRDVPVGEALDRLVAGVESFTGDAELKDDASILALEIDRAE
jgi:sigma-B regulation protein RsbU (phosphoserine phosphatase)